MEAHQAMKLQETHARGTMFVGAESIWKAFPANSKPRMSSCVSEPCKLNPCPSVCYLHVLTKAQGKGTWALPKKNLAKALDEYLAKEGCLEHPFSKQILRNDPSVVVPVDVVQVEIAEAGVGGYPGLAAALSKGIPRPRKTPAWAHAARWSPNGSKMRRHRQMRADRGSGRRRRRRSRTRKR